MIGTEAILPPTCSPKKVEGFRLWQTISFYGMDLPVVNRNPSLRSMQDSKSCVFGGSAGRRR